MDRKTWKKLVAALLCLGMMAFSAGSLYAGDTPYDGEPDQDQVKDKKYLDDPQHDQDPDKIRDKDRFSNDTELLILEKGRKK